MMVNRALQSYLNHRVLRAQKMSAQNNILNLNNNVISRCSHFILCELCGNAFSRVSLVISLLFVFNLALFTVPVFAQQDDMVKAIQKKSKELKEKEETLKKEEERLNLLKKEVDERIEKYTAIMNQIEAAVKKLEETKDAKFEHVVKSYELMPPEEAAARLSALDMATAVRIMLKMKSKKAAGVIALMETKTAAAITSKMLANGKKVPAK